MRRTPKKNLFLEEESNKR